MYLLVPTAAANTPAAMVPVALPPLISTAASIIDTNIATTVGVALHSNECST